MASLEYLLTGVLTEDLEAIKTLLGHSSDLVIRKFVLDGKTETGAAAVFLDGLASVETIDHLLEILMFGTSWAVLEGRQITIPANSDKTALPPRQHLMDTTSITSPGQDNQQSINHFEANETADELENSSAERTNPTHLSGLENIINSLPAGSGGKFSQGSSELEVIINSLPTHSTDVTQSLERIAIAITSGYTAFLFSGIDKALLVDTKGWDKRGVEEPDTESVTRGPKEGFTESIRTNIALLRRRIRNPNLRVQNLHLGTYSITDVAIVYIEGLASPELVREVRQRLSKVQMDAILESGYIEELIQDRRFAPFPIIASTQRPDVVAAKLLEGRVAIFVDGTPFVLTAPAVFVEFLQAAEDYYHSYIVATLLRVFRTLALIIALFLPAVYVALTSYHSELIPIQLLISTAAAEEGTPFPVMVEILIMGVIFELLREAGVRMPRPVGQTVSIVGALVLGEAAIRAGFAADSVVITVGITAITTFIIPSNALAYPISLTRLFYVLLAGFLGFFGMVIGTLLTFSYLCSITSFGVPYFYPLAPAGGKDVKDTLVRVPWWSMKTRPQLLSPNQTVRISTTSQNLSTSLNLLLTYLADYEHLLMNITMDLKRL